MTVSDDGQGMTPGGRDKTNSFGLVGIEERVKILGGSFMIRSQPGEGTTISVSVAVRPRAVPDEARVEPVMMDG